MYFKGVFHDFALTSQSTDQRPHVAVTARRGTPVEAPWVLTFNPLCVLLAPTTFSHHVAPGDIFEL